MAEGRPGRGAPDDSVRRVRVQALVLLRRHVLPACSRACLPYFPAGGSCRCEGPSPIPQRTLLQASVACCGAGKIAPGGWGALCLGEECPGVCTLRPPAARPAVLRPGPAARSRWVLESAGVEPVTVPTAHALGSSYGEVSGWHVGGQGMAPHASLRGVQVGALFLPTLPFPRACSQGAPPFYPRRGGFGCGALSSTPLRTLLCTAVERWGASRKAPSGGALCLQEGCSSFSTLPRLIARRSN